MERNMLAKEISNLFMEQESSSLLGTLANANPIEFVKRVMQAKIVQFALQEWELWGKGQLEESSKEALPLLIKYWKEVDDLSDSKAEQFARNYKVQHWSAAFVGYIMKRAYPQFPSSPNHMGYYQWALKNTKIKGGAPFFVFKPQDAIIEVGDILLNTRPGGSHGDIVIKVGSGKAEVIGGNVGNDTSGNSGVTVNIKTRKLNSRNKLENPAKFFAVIKLLPGKAGNTTIASNSSPAQNRKVVEKNHATPALVSPWQILPATVHTAQPFRNGNNIGPHIKITEEDIQKLGGGKQSISYFSDIVKVINQYSFKFGVASPLRMAHFIGQLSVETSNFTKKVEDLNYTPKRMMKVFHKYFKSIESTLPYVNNPEALGNFVYQNRGGNDTPGDGFLFRGRGFIQVTFKANYKEFTKWYNSQNISTYKINFVETPELVGQLPYSILSAFWFFNKKGLNDLADNDNIHEISRRINGNGYKRSFENRRLRTDLAKKILGVI